MKFFLTCDVDWESRIDKVLHALIDSGIKAFFEKKEYGDSLIDISINLNCNNPDYNHKQRIRFLKLEKVLYLDLMFDLNQFKSIEQSERQNIVAKKMVTELPAIIAKYKFKNFDLLAFEADLVGCFKQIKWL
ncbi:MAG: hypothetical protein H7Z76_10500 [Methylotenera sp.]|nr:hypothetical protein [Flavobacterium sp.]